MPKQMPETDFTTPAIIALYAVGGVYVLRFFKGSTSQVPIPVIATIAGTVAASSAIAARVLPSVMCPKADIAPVAQAAISTGLSWVALNVVADMETANSMVPVSMGADLLGNYAAHMVIQKTADPEEGSRPKTKEPLHTDDEEAPNLKSMLSFYE